MNKKKISPYKLWNGSFVPEWLMPRKELSQGAKLCYSRLARFAGKDDHCNPQVGTLADAIGVSERQCSSYISELVEHDLVGKKRRGMGKSNVYIFYWHRWMTPRSEASNTSDQERKYTSGQNANRPSEATDTSVQETKNTSDQETKNTSGPYSNDRRESIEESQERARVNGCPIPDELRDVKGFKPKYQKYCEYLKENYNRHPTASTTEVDLQRLSQLKRKGNPPKQVIDQTIQARNKSFYAIKNFDGDEDKPFDAKGRANASAYEEYEDNF